MILLWRKERAALQGGNIYALHEKDNVRHDLGGRGRPPSGLFRGRLRRAQRRLLQLLPHQRRKDHPLRHGGQGRGARFLRQRGLCPGRAEAGLPGRLPHGARPRRHHRGHRPALSGGDDRLQREDQGHALALLPHGPLRARPAREGGRHAEHRAAHLHLRDGADGPLAGSDDDLRHDGQDPLLGGRLRQLRR